MVLTVSIVAAACLTTNGFADELQQPDKPIDDMTPTDLFLDSQLRQLAEAAQHGDVNKIGVLTAKGVDVNGKGRYGITPLFSAVQVGNKIGYKALLEHGADPNNVWTNGYTLMNVIAGSSPDPFFMQLALEHGGNPNLLEPKSGNTPLLAAVTLAGKVNIPLLIKAGANMNQQRPIGRQTAMMQAMLHAEEFDVVYELLIAGADYRLMDSGEQDIRDYVKVTLQGDVSPEDRQWRDRVIAFLKQHDFWERIAFPTNFSVSTNIVLTGDVYRLSWDKVAQASSYELRLNEKNDETRITTTYIQKTAPDRQHTIDGDLIWSVRACGDGGCSAWSPNIRVYVKSNDQ
jgi:hypothetical protein